MYRENIGTCRICGKRIRFIRMKSGKSMPVDETFVNYKLAAGGKDRIVTPTGEVVTCIAGVDVGEADGFGYVSHFATCPNASRHRRGD